MCVLRGFSHVQLCVTQWTVAHQTPLSMGFSRQEYWSGLPWLPPRDLPNPGIKPSSLTFPTLEAGSLPLTITWEVPYSLALVQFSSVAQSCLTLCDPMDCSPPGYSVQGILQTRILEWVAISYFKGSSWSRDRTQVSCIAGRFTVWATGETTGKVLIWLQSLLVLRIKTKYLQNSLYLRFSRDCFHAVTVLSSLRR